MTFFGDIGDFFKDQVWGNVLKPIAEPVYNEILKPVVSTVGGFVSPIINSAGRLGGKIIDTGGRLVDTGGRFVEGTAGNLLNVEKGLGNLISSPFLYIGLGIVAIVVLPKLLDRV
jgi:hypothetical protein